MKRWEYKIIDSKDIQRKGLLKGPSKEAIERFINELGDAGWSIINLDFNDLKEKQSAFIGVAKREKA